jgi:hypothetical protein
VTPGIVDVSASSLLSFSSTTFLSFYVTQASDLRVDDFSAAMLAGYHFLFTDPTLRLLSGRVMIPPDGMEEYGADRRGA